MEPTALVWCDDDDFGLAVQAHKENESYHFILFRAQHTVKERPPPTHADIETIAIML